MKKFRKTEKVSQHQQAPTIKIQPLASFSMSPRATLHAAYIHLCSYTSLNTRSKDIQKSPQKAEIIP